MILILFVFKDVVVLVVKFCGVRFEILIDLNDKFVVVFNKVNVWIGGVVIEFFGRECSIFVELSVVKIVSCLEGLGVVIMMFRVFGFYLINLMVDLVIMIEVGGVCLDFLIIL